MPDSVDGRFDLIVLHVALLIHRLREASLPEAGEFARALQEVFFADMDRNLREMGVSDTGVSKRIKKMVEAFYGRLHAYEQALRDPAQWAESLRRNLYRGSDIEEASLQPLMNYIHSYIAALNAEDMTRILSGDIRFSSL